MSESTPRLSVVLVAYGGSEDRRPALRCLSAQTVAHALECIIVAHPDSGFELRGDELARLCATTVLKSPAVTSEGEAKAAGVAAARAPLVAFTEDHCYPDREWAEVLMRTHQEGDFAAVGPAVLNANPHSRVGSGGFLLFYSPFMAPVRGEAQEVPGNQSCYRREVLMEYGDRLAKLLECETLLHWDLRARGFRLRMEPAARTYHLNYARVGPLLHEAHWVSRSFAAQRAAGWAPAKRLVYTLGSPLLPAIRLRCILAGARRASLGAGVLGRALPGLSLALCASAAGELLGYALGSRGAAQRRFRAGTRPYASLTPREVEAVNRLCPPE